MKSYAFYFLLLISSLLISCGDKPEEILFEIQTKENKTNFSINESLTLVLQNPKNLPIDSVTYEMRGQQLSTSSKNEAFPVRLATAKLGKNTIQATVYFNKKKQTVSKELIFLSDTKPKLYEYKVINTYPHDSNAYTQGLEFYDGVLYESTGQYGKSSLRKTDYTTGQVLQKVDLDRRYFGEGVTVMNGKIYQLTWRENTGFVYDAETLEKIDSFVYGESKEGWGLCNNGTTVYKSDGTEKIWTLNPNTLVEEDYIEIYTNTSRIKSVNELEWVDGKIYANIYQQNAVAIINPTNGAVEGVINLDGLQKLVKQHPALDVLNGIAYKGEKNRLFITGKNWDKLFEIEIFEK
jgi:glutamine cyclotransferase